MSEAIEDEDDSIEIESSDSGLRSPWQGAGGLNVGLRPEPESLNIISLCTGGGGLDLGVELAMPGECP